MKISYLLKALVTSSILFPLSTQVLAQVSSPQQKTKTVSYAFQAGQTHESAALEACISRAYRDTYTTLNDGKRAYSARIQGNVLVVKTWDHWTRNGREGGKAQCQYSLIYFNPPEIR